MTARMIAAAGLLVLTTGTAWGQTVPDILPRAPPVVARAAEPTDPTTDLLRELVLNAIPREYENLKHWGKTKKAWDGVHVALDGWRVKTKRKWREVKDGTWKRYRAWLINPEQELDAQIVNSRPIEGGAAFDVLLHARLGLFGRLSQYERDVQLVSVSAEAEAVVTIGLNCEMKLDLDWSSLPPVVVLRPRVVNGELLLDQFQLKEVSDHAGPLVTLLGDGLEDVLREEIRDRRAKLVEQANRQIAKQQDKLRLSFAHLAQAGWRNLLPATEIR